MALHSARGVGPTSRPHGCAGGCTESLAPPRGHQFCKASGNAPTCFEQPANAGFLSSLLFSLRDIFAKGMRRITPQANFFFFNIMTSFLKTMCSHGVFFTKTKNSKSQQLADPAVSIWCCQCSLQQMERCKHSGILDKLLFLSLRKQRCEMLLAPQV